MDKYSRSMDGCNYMEKHNKLMDKPGKQNRYSMGMRMQKFSCGVGDTWNLVNKKEPNDNDKHGNLNHFLEMNEYDMMDYGKQHLVINEFKVFDGAWFLENIDYKLGFAHCLDFIDLKIFEHHYMNSFVDTVFNGWQCLVKYVLKVTIFILRFFLYMVDKVMVIRHSGLMQLAVVWLCSLS